MSKYKKEKFTLKIRLIIIICVIVFSAITAVCGWLFLPEQVNVTADFSNAAKDTVPKAIGIIIPLLLTIVFSILFLLSNSKTKYLGLSILGILLQIIVIFINK